MAIWSARLLSTLTIKGRWAAIVLILFAMATALTVIDTALWWLDGPRYVHRMWFEDRMDRIREDDKLRALIEQERAERELALQALRDARGR